MILVPGPDDEIAVVNRIYRLFVEDGLAEMQIASVLNGEGIPTDLGRPWTRGTVHQVLTNEKYIGNNVYNRVSFKLKKRRVTNPPAMWVRADRAFEAVVEPPLFYAAQGIIRERSRRYSDADMLQHLQRLYQQHGWLSAIIIDEAEGAAGGPGSGAYRCRFGSLLRAYTLVGYTPDRDFRYLEINRRVRELHPRIVAEVVAAMCGSDMGAQSVARRLFRGKLGRCGRAIRAVPAKRDLPERAVVFGTNFVSGKEAHAARPDRLSDQLLCHPLDQDDKQPDGPAEHQRPRHRLADPEMRQSGGSTRSP